MSEEIPELISAEDYVVLPSRTGMGLFARKTIPKGSYILEYLGERVPAHEGSERDSLYIFAVDENWDIDGTPEWNTARYMNHSCDPNAESEDIDGRIFIQAIRDIAPEEEITYDYGEEYVGEYIRPQGCKCARCVARSS
jgi:SET domain-containing protein